MKAAFEVTHSRILEIRNDRDQRQGLQYLRIAGPRVAELVTARISGDHVPDSSDGFLDGSRYTIRCT